MKVKYTVEELKLISFSSKGAIVKIIKTIADKIPHENFKEYNLILPAVMVHS